MSYRKLLPVVVMVAGLGCFADAATTYYVDSQNGSDSRAGTSDATSWQSLSKVNGTSFVAGDTIKFKCGGTWTGGLTLNRSGSSGNPIVYTNYGTGAKPKITYPTGKPIVNVTGSYVVLDGFFLTQTSVSLEAAGVKTSTSSSHGVFRNLEVSLVAEGIWIGGSNHLVTNCYIHDLFMGRNTQGGDDDCGARAVTFSGCSDVEVSYSRMEDCVAPSYDYGTDGGAIEIWQAATRVKFHHNYIRRTNGFLEGGGTGQTVSDIAIYYNVIVDNVGVWLAVHTNDNFSINVSNFRMDNNTLINCGGVWNDGSWLALRNNVLYNTSGGGNQSNNFSGNPGFVNLGAGDYHLQSSATGCIDKGTNVGLATDYDGIPVPQGSAPDIGAFEFVLDDLTPPSAPGNLSAQTVNAHAVSLTWTAATDAQTGILKYVVYRDGQKVGESTTLTFTDSATVVASTTYQYQVSAVNRAYVEGSKSSALGVTTPGDTQAPIITQAGVSSATQVTVTFSEPVEQSSAQTAGNYAVSGAITISSAALGTDLRTVTLTTSTMTAGSTYALTVNNVRDRAPSPNTIAPNLQVSITYYAGITKIRFHPRSGWAPRMDGGVFEGTNGDKDAGPYIEVYTITSSPIDGQWTEVTSLASMSGFRYVRYRASGFCNVAEIGFYRGAQKVTGPVFGTPGSWGNSGNDYTKAFDGDINTYMDFTSDAGGYTGIDLQGGATVAGERHATLDATAQGLRILPHALLAVPRGRFSLRVVNAAGVTILRECGVGPKICDLSRAGVGMFCVTVTINKQTVSGRIVAVK